MANKKDEESQEARDPLLSEKSTEPTGITKISSRISTKAKYAVGFGAVVTLLFALILLLYLSHMHQLSTNLFKPEPPDHTFCGKTPADAVKNGCHYEPMISSWVPEACYFIEAQQGYDVYSDLDWFADPFLRQPLNETEMIDLRRGFYSHVYTTWQYHDEHCLYNWRKLAMAVEKRLPLIESKTADEEHSQHCAKVTRNYVRKDGQETIADLKTVALKVTLTMKGCVALF
ncbi:hypothetical protein HYALB_00005044 [Hymenoscyphus albidus]|uniref:Uncharacterized protein n=1 Tax=Hymenoscyphus albidus TaxID=595503 RepID=A0A9N9LND8_9HELO|nr:hypothetical protein HYALB_00005044 [Hymenoscyphus albidus]